MRDLGPAAASVTMIGLGDTRAVVGDGDGLGEGVVSFPEELLVACRQWCGPSWWRQVPSLREAMSALEDEKVNVGWCDGQPVIDVE